MNHTTKNTWKAEKTDIQKESVHKYFIFQNENLLSYSDFLHHLSDSQSFRVFYNTLLADCDFKAFFWENPPTSKSSLDQNYEFVLIKNDFLSSVQANAQTFASHFSPKETVVDFPNLGGDTRLIVPTPISTSDFYSHLGNFVRNAPLDQIDAFWKKVGEKYLESVKNGKYWLSTSGLGVYWLHVRIDTIPKYYGHQEYRIG
ncbi:MAG: hypothetical protein NW226_03995 [Microscillaceae bacterium]|nr:hypothetical protein [Microscillaceae bacterium]